MKLFELREVDDPIADSIDLLKSVVETVSTVISHTSLGLQGRNLPFGAAWTVECHPDGGGPVVYLSIRISDDLITLHASTRK